MMCRGGVCQLICVNGTARYPLSRSPGDLAGAYREPGAIGAFRITEAKKSIRSASL